MVCPNVLSAMKRWVLVVSLPLAFVSHVSAFHLSVSKSCPASVQPGSNFTCTFSVQNEDSFTSVPGITVTNTVPWPGGTTAVVPCNQDGSPVTTLGPKGSATDTCTGSVSETAPACIFGMSGVVDRLCASDPSSSGGTCTTVGVSVPPCTPAPTAPTNTPTLTTTPPTPTYTPTLGVSTPTLTYTPTNAPTNTPSRTNTPTITPTPGPGIAVFKSCQLVCFPCAQTPFFGIPTYTLVCSFSVVNLDPKHDFVIVSVSDRATAGSGWTTGPLRGCSPFTFDYILPPGGSCAGEVLSGTPNCDNIRTDQILGDEIDVQGYSKAPGAPNVSGSATASTVLSPCGFGPRPTSRTLRVVPFRGTPGPAENAVTPSSDAPGQVPTNTPTNTPTPTNTSVEQQAVVPTPSFPMLGLLAAILIGAAPWLMRR
jgi:hypothetical protein